MTVKSIDCIWGAKAWFDQVEFGHLYQSYWVLLAVEKVEVRRFIVRCLLRPWRFFDSRPVFRTIAVLDEQSNVVLLAPLECNGSCAKIAGSSQSLDYTDLLYRRNLSQAVKGEAWSALVSYLKAEGFQSLEFKQLVHGGDSERYLLEHGATLESTSQSVSISLRGKSYDEYFASLGKHAKQNVRTAYNRLKRSGYQATLRVFSNVGIGESLGTYFAKKEISRNLWLYVKRQALRYKNGGGVLRWIALRYFNYTTLSSRSPVGFFAELVIGSEVCAFMEGYVNQDSRTIELPRLAINDKYNWYSPGLLLVNEVAREIFQIGGGRIDLCRGTEKYKIDMGGEIYETRTFKLVL